MHEAIEEDAATNQILTVAETTIASLYEPYTGSYYVAGPNLNDPPLFQPGFEYRFVECDCTCNEPTAYEDISFSYNGNTFLKIIDKYEDDYSTIFHPNHSAIVIKHLEPTNTFYPQPRRCYDNNNKAPSGGTVTRFNDGVFNANVTMTPKDSLGINSPILIESLTPGLYTVDKDFQDGSTEQTVILKENN